MSQDATYREMIEEASALVQQAARRGTITVSPEVAAMLDQVAAPATTATAEPPAASAPEPAAAPAPAPPPSRSLDSLEAIAQAVDQCEACPLCSTRNKTVPGAGHPNADLVFVGEAPGADEDRQGLPFVGAAGRLLNDIIVKGMKLQRDDVFICNTLKCRPPGNRTPNSTEIAACKDFLSRQIELIQPKVICALGRPAANTLLNCTESVGRMRGKWHDYHGIPLRVTYHPSYLLHCKPDRVRGEKMKVWQDVQEVMKVLNGEITP